MGFKSGRKLSISAPFVKDADGDAAFLWCGLWAGANVRRMTVMAGYDAESGGAGRGLDGLPVMALSVRESCRLDADGVIETLRPHEAAGYLAREPHLIVSRPAAARRLNLSEFQAFDLLELYAFVRPARYCLPTLGGLMKALSLDLPIATLEDQCMAMRAVAERLLAEAGSEIWRYRAGAERVASMMARAGWAWGPMVMGAVRRFPDHSRDDGLRVWTALPEWEDMGPPPPPGDGPVDPAASESRLAELLGDASETREGQRRFAAAATHSFRPREMEGGPNMQILEAGTGTGKTLGYIAPASLWAETNGAPVWLSTFTKNLQRQLDQELSRLYPDPVRKARKAVIRKGRENYACLLNIEETLTAVMQRGALPLGGGADRDSVLMGLVVRWARFTRDGDMIGGDFPSWLGAHFGAARIAGLTDRRGECLYAACQHYRRCYIERAARKARHADLVVANHALTIAQAANRYGDPDLPKRLVFDEGHHLFDAADSAFAVALTGLEGAELRRWIRGKESGGTTRARGLRNRIEELIADDADAKALLDGVLEAARVLPSDGWASRVAGAAAMTRFETFLMEVRAVVLARANNVEFGLAVEAGVAAPPSSLLSAAGQLAEALSGLARPMVALAASLLARLDEDADILETGDRGRLEVAARSLKLRAEMVKSWTEMLLSLGGTVPDIFVDWFELDRVDGRERDVGMRRHFIDPTKPLADMVFSPAHGVLVTSATLRDRAADKEGDGWAGVDLRSGAKHLPVVSRRLAVPSPFDYAAQTRVIVVNDVNRMDAAQVASAYRELFLASGGGGLGLFTAIKRLKATWDKIAGPMEEAGLPLYAQHVDPIDTATLVDIFRDDPHACLLGTDAVRDGVDVPGESLRLLVLDRVPWPRPTLLHKARRDAFGGTAYDDMQTRMKLAQGFGRLIRRAGDRGVFVILDARTPSRLLEGLPEGVVAERLGLAAAIASVREFFGR